MAEVDDPPNLALACVFCGEWCSTDVTVSGEEEGCEAKAPVDEAWHDCETSYRIARTVHLQCGTLVNPPFEVSEYTDLVGLSALL